MIKMCEQCEKEFRAAKAKRCFCSNRCQAINREKMFSVKFNGTRPWRRVMSDEQIKEALILSANGMSVNDVAKKIGRAHV